MLTSLLHGGLRRVQKLVFELLVPLCFDVSAVQPDLLARSIASALDSLVMGSFL